MSLGNLESAGADMERYLQMELAPIKVHVSFEEASWNSSRVWVMGAVY